MRWLTTIFLLVLVLAGVGYLAWPGPNAVSVPETVATLAEHVQPNTVKRIERTEDGKEPLTLTRAADGEWSQPGNWPVRQVEANELATALGSMKSRFQPIGIAADTDLKPYGLDPSQKPVKVRIDAATKTLTLTFGQAPDEKGSSFGKATYVRLDDKNEVLRLGPDAWAAVTKPVDAYRRRQLFPDLARVKMPGDANPMNPMVGAAATRTAIPTDKLTAVRVESPNGGYAIQRVSPTPGGDDKSGEPTLQPVKLAGAWELTDAGTPVAKALKDHVDPAKLKSLLTSIPEIWAEAFVPEKPDTETGLDKPARSIQLTFANGTSTALRIGKLARKVERDGPPPPPSQPFAPPPPPSPKKIEEYYYAKLDNNPLIFEVKGDKFADVFAMPDEVRDANLTRLESGDIDKVTIAVKGQSPITLTKTKGNKDAEKDDEKSDRWYQVGKLAEQPKIMELVDSLLKMEAKTREERIDDADAKKLTELGFDPAATKVTLGAGAKSETFVIGKADAEKKKLHVQVAGLPRVNVVGDDALKLIERPALAYRGRRLFDTADNKVTSLAVTPKDGAAFAIREENKKWSITQPVLLPADESKAGAMAGDLGRAEVIDYVNDAPKPDELAKYGLDKPSLTLKLGFEKNKESTLEIGNSPEFKPEVYARLAGTNSVFTLPKATIDAVTAGAATLLPLVQWAVPAEKVVALEVTRADGEKYKISNDSGNWKVSGAFEGPVPFLTAQPLTTATANVKAEKFETISTTDLAKYGLDKPTVKVAVTYRDMVNDKEENVTKTLLVGGSLPDNPAMRYAKLEGSPGVFVMPDALAKEVDKPALERLDRTLYSIDAMAIAKVAISSANPADSSTLVWEKNKDGGPPKVKMDGKPFAVDAPAANNLLFAVTRPLAVRLAAYGSNLNFTEYGLAKPDATITVTMTDGKTHVIKLGKVVPPGGQVLEAGGRFARVDDGPAVAVLSAAHADALTRKPLEFVDKALLGFDPTQVMGFTRTEGKSTLEIAPGANAGFDIVQPAKQKADTAMLDELFDQLSRLRAASVAAYEPADLEPYGLNTPDAVVTVKVGLDKPVDKVLKIGHEVDEGKTGDRYATVDGKTVGVLPFEFVRKLMAPPLKFRDRTLAKFVDADKATLVRGDRTVTFAKVNGTWKVVKPIVADAEQADLDDLVNVVAKLKADELAAEKSAKLDDYGLEKPDAVWTFTSGDKDVLKLAIGKTADDKRVYAKVDGSDVVALLEPTLAGKLASEFRKRSVWSGVDAAQAETIAISGNAAFGLRKQGNVWVDTESGKPANAAAVTELLDALAGLKAEKYVADEKGDAKLYGLEPPQRVIMVMLKGGVVKTLYLGREEGGHGGRVYAKVADKDRTDVFVLSKADTAKLMKDKAAFAGK